MGRTLILLTALFVVAAAPLSAAGRAPRSASPDPPARIAFWLWPENGDGGKIVTVRADRQGGVRQLIPGKYNQSFCQSADARKIVYFSDREAPNEFFIYVANTDGTQAEKITERQAGFLCPFSERWLLLSKKNGLGWTLVRYDLQTGAEKTALTYVDRDSLSADGSKLLFVGGVGKETLELLDLTTLDRRRLAGPLAEGSSYYLNGGWSSPDGSQIAYAVGPPYQPGAETGSVPKTPAQPYAVYVQPVTGGAARMVLRLSGGPPTISWSPDGRRLLVCAETHSATAFKSGCDGSRCGCVTARRLKKFTARLVLVDLARRSVRPVASGKLVFAQWAPSGRRYAYATFAAVYVARPGGTRRRLALAPKPNPAAGIGGWPGGSWMGWSPDGRYIGLGSFSSRVAVLNAATGQKRLLYRDPEGAQIMEPRWWRSRPS